MGQPDSLDAFRHWLIEGREWMEHARCRELKMPAKERVDVFFPASSQRIGKLAKKTCAGCPVKVECDQYARDTNTQYGMWGGQIRIRYATPELDAPEEVVT